MSNTYLSHGEILKKIREYRGLSLTKVEKITGISDATISNYENDNTKKKDHKCLEELAKAYNVPLTVVTASYEATDEKLIAFIRINDNKKSGNEVKSSQKSTSGNGNAMEEQKTQKTPTLLDEFEDAIYMFGFIDFINTYIPFKPLPYKLKKSVDDFYNTLRDVLRSHRRNQDEIYMGILRFADTLSMYVCFLGERMSLDEDISAESDEELEAEDEDISAESDEELEAELAKRKFVADPKIDKDKSERQAFDYLKELDIIYNEITNGGTLFIA